MATVAVTDVVQGYDEHLTRTKTDNESKTTGDVYSFPTTQNHIKIANTGGHDLLISIGRHTNTILHPGDEFDEFVHFKTFDIKSFGGATTFDFTTRELGTTPIDDITDLWEHLALRDLASDMVHTASNLTTSTATINTAIASAAKKYETEFEVTIKNAAGSATQEWYSGNMPVSVSKTSTAGIVSIVDNLKYITFINGVGKIKVVMTGTWAQADVVKLTIAATDVMGYTVAAKDITDTLGA